MDVFDLVVFHVQMGALILNSLLFGENDSFVSKGALLLREGAFPQFGFGQMSLKLRAWTTSSVVSETLTTLWISIVFVLGT